MRDSGKHLDKWRRVHPTMGPSPFGALWGYFRVRTLGVVMDVISSGEHRGNGLEAWEHVSVTLPYVEQCPTWEQMCEIKALFWRPDETVIQFHPPESEYVSHHKHCLHLWRPPYELALPSTITLGPVTGRV